MSDLLPVLLTGLAIAFMLGAFAALAASCIRQEQRHEAARRERKRWRS